MVPSDSTMRSGSTRGNEVDSKIFFAFSLSYRKGAMGERTARFSSIVRIMGVFRFGFVWDC